MNYTKLIVVLATLVIVIAGVYAWTTLLAKMNIAWWVEHDFLKSLDYGLLALLVVPMIGIAATSIPSLLLGRATCSQQENTQNTVAKARRARFSANLS